MASNFDKVTEFNKSFGIQTHETIQKNIFKGDPKLVKLRLDLIKEEVDELTEAIDNHNMVETIDALADILYCVYGAAASFGIDMDKAIDLVHESNMSKICRNREVAERTVVWYKEQFAAGKLPYDSVEMRKHSSEDGRWVVFNKSSLKILKSIEYSPVSFDEMLA